MREQPTPEKKKTIKKKNKKNKHAEDLWLLCVYNNWNTQV